MSGIEEEEEEEEDEEGTLVLLHAPAAPSNRIGEDCSGSNDRPLLLERCRRLWRAYLRRVRRSQSFLLMADDLVERLMFFAPVGNQRQQRWTEVVFGVLQLNRLSIDLAEQQREGLEGCGDGDGQERNPYGTSVAVSRSSSSSSAAARTTTTTNNFPAVGVRIALTIIQCLWPVVEQVAASGSGGGTTTMASSIQRDTTQRRQARARSLMERVRFLLRLSLLFNYWREFAATKKRILMTQRGENHDIAEDGEGSSCQRDEEAVLPGLLLDGGLYNNSPSEASAPTVEQERSRFERSRYIGRRTGRKIHAEAAGQRRPSSNGHPSNEGNDTSSGHSGRLSSSPPQRRMKMFRIVVGELLYIIRPLIQAEVQQQQEQSKFGIIAPARNVLLDRTIQQSAASNGRDTMMKLWISCLSLDLASLFVLRDGGDRQERRPRRRSESSPASAAWNAVTHDEWNRRRWRLLLYLLRSPIWDRYTQPTAERVGDAAGYVPLVGGLLQNYLWDWLYYWKLYRAEEG